MAAAMLASAAAPAAATEVPIQTASLSMRDDASPPLDASKRRFKFRSSTRDEAGPNRIVVPSRSGSDDPTLVGATLVVEATAGSGERVVYPLTRTLWKAIGDAGTPKGYQYQLNIGPIRRVTIKEDSLKISAAGSGFAYSLDEATQGSVGVRLEIGDVAWCADAAARVGGEPPSSEGYDEPGRFSAQPDSPAPASCPVAGTSYRLTVHDGYGSGRYAPGTLVHVWAALFPDDELLTSWIDDDSLLAEPLEWHSTLVMPAHDAEVGAVIASQSFNFTTGTFFGATARAKTFYRYIPPSPRGIVLMLHGSGGGAEFIRRTEPRAIAQRLVHAGYGVIGPEAEEAVGGDLNDDGEERWDTALDASNIDLANLNDLVSDLRAAGTIPADAPLFVTGFSNGSSTSVLLGAVAHTALAADFPELVFGAVVGYCAPALLSAVAATETPTGWFMCANDEHPEFDNSAALAESNYLASQGVPTFYEEHPASPLYDQRFERVAGVSAATSAAIANEIRVADFVDSNDNFLVSARTVELATGANPALLPTFSAQTLMVRRRLLDQIGAMHADHQTFSDWAQRTVAWFDQYNP